MEMADIDCEVGVGISRCQAGNSPVN